MDVPILDPDFAETVGTNYLKGSATAATTLDPTAGTYYVYGIYNDKAGFYRLSGSGTANSAKGKAYLELPAGVPAPSFLGIAFSDNVTTGITEITPAMSANPSAIIYDLQGRQVTQNLKKGLYIVNGKKVVKR